jgi:hypothetical protein
VYVKGGGGFCVGGIGDVTTGTLGRLWHLYAGRRVRRYPGERLGMSPQS